MSNNSKTLQFNKNKIITRKKAKHIQFSAVLTADNLSLHNIE